MTAVVEISDDLERRLDELVRRTGRSRAEVVRGVLMSGLDDIEDYFEALAVSDRVRRVEEKTFTAAEIRREFGMDD